MACSIILKHGWGKEGKEQYLLQLPARRGGSSNLEMGGWDRMLVMCVVDDILLFPQICHVRL